MAALAALLLMTTGESHAQTVAPAPSASPSPPPDYADPAAWLCRPGRADACAADMTATVVAADGALTREAFQPRTDAPIDCFYVYPTVSTDTTPNSDMTADDAERYVVAQQFARFASVCRTFAPLYRQVTLAALRARVSGRPSGADPGMAFADVQAAWRHYLAHDNGGRGVVLIGHSQGAGILTALIASDIDGKPVQSKIVSAMLLGTNVPVLRGQHVGGVFKSMPACTRADETGCVISYVSFRDTTPPPESARFGTTQTSAQLSLPAGADLAAVCVNPAALLHGGDEAPLHSYLAATGRAIVAGIAPPVWAAGRTVDTPFVSTPGLLTAKCVSTPTHTYLSVHTNAVADDPRIDAVPGDVIVNGAVLPDWGLHLIDMNEAMGDLVEIAGKQGAAYAASRRSR